jgi:uncharacterized protein YcbK (DUF882 family)
MDFLYDLQTEVGNHGDVHIISGYRSPVTNNKLRQNSKGVAKGSLHMQGKANEIIQQIPEFCGDVKSVLAH